MDWHTILSYIVGSFLMALTQGYVLGRFVTGFGDSVLHHLFSLAIALCVCATGGDLVVTKNRKILTNQSSKMGKSSVVWCGGVFGVGVAGNAFGQPNGFICPICSCCRPFQLSRLEHCREPKCC